MTNNRTVTCQHCKKELPPDHKGHCPSCGSNKILFKISVGDGVILLRGGLQIRKKVKGFHEFAIKIVQRWRPSGDPKLGGGVNCELVIDKEKGIKHHITRDALTGEITHEEHEPLSRHKHQPKQQDKRWKQKSR